MLRSNEILGHRFSRVQETVVIIVVAAAAVICTGGITKLIENSSFDWKTSNRSGLSSNSGIDISCALHAKWICPEE